MNSKKLSIIPSDKFRFHAFSLYVNVIGILLWTILYILLELHKIPEQVQYIHAIYFTMLAIFIHNIYNSDNTGDSSYENEMKIKDDVENLSIRLCVLIATVLFSTSIFDRFKYIPKNIKQHFMTILSTAMIILLMVSSSINIPKQAKYVRRLRKFESVLMNISIGFISVAFMLMIHYL